MNPRFFTCLAAGLFGAVSCIDYTEEFTIKLNGSGTIHSVISMKTELAKDDPDKLKNDLEKMFAGSEGLTLADYTVYTETDRRITDFSIAFDNPSDLGSALEGGDSNVTKYFGVFEALEQSDRFVMTRTIDLSSGGISGDDPDAGGTVKKFLAGALLSDSYLTYRMRFPTKILSANSQNIDAGTNTVEWKFSVAQAAKAPLVMTAEIQKPPILKWALIAGAVLVALAIGVVVFRKCRRPARG